MKIPRYLLMSGVALSLTACGDGGGGGTGGTTIDATKALATGTYKLTFTAISTARLDAPISGIEVAVKLPAGISVATAGGGSGQVAVSSITPGSSILGTELAYGNYSASTRTVYLTLATTQSAFRGGEFLNLLFTAAADTTVSPNDIMALNAVYPHYKVVGLNTATSSTVNMTGKVKTTLGVNR
jgi:hypothetical protein